MTPLPRRQWLQGIIFAVSSSSTYASVAVAASTASPSKSLSLVSSKSTCDPTVSIWKRENRIIYLLGTAHISEESASLAGKLVEDVHPEAVFIELDIKRVGGLSKTTAPSYLSLITTDDSGNTLPASRLIVPAVSTGTDSDLSATVTTSKRGGSEGAYSASDTNAISPLKRPVEPSSASTAKASFLSRLSPKNNYNWGLDLGTAAVGNAIRGMYRNLNEAGFNPGNEFVEAVRVGRSYGADVVLGDRDVQVTLRRLVQALQVTDVSALMDPDSELEQSMRELLPATAESSSSSTPSTKEELTTFVESIKTRERVRSIMQSLRTVAPALVQVMLTERDAYMAAGLDSLQQYVVIVAVMGMAHQDGVEANLQSVGWTQMKPKCSWL